MPSDSKKRQQQKKKDAAKARQAKPAASKTDTNGVSNGDESIPISEEGNIYIYVLNYHSATYIITGGVKSLN